ncbi:glycosyltransferase family 25 protein, partial [Periconia macrospinosa]
LQCPRTTILITSIQFEQIFVINAPWRTDRKDAMSLIASYHDISFKWINGVNSTQITDSAFPPGKHQEIPPGARGCWRAHMNALQHVVAQNLSTALIFEDDVDWDIRLRSQLLNLSRASRNLPKLITHANKKPHTSPTIPQKQTQDPIDLAHRSSMPISQLTSTSISNEAPYGVDWDVLWLGHCGATLPPPSPMSPDRIVQLNDETVPSPSHLRRRRNAAQDEFASLYPPYTRVYHRTANSTLCLHAYAVTRRGARKLLYQFGIRGLGQGYDFALSDYCGGGARGEREGEGERPMCLTVQPPLYSQFWSERGESDIMATGREGRMSGSRYIRRSVRMGLEGLVGG